MTRREARRSRRAAGRPNVRLVPVIGALSLLVLALIAWVAWPRTNDSAVATDPDAPGRLVAAQPLVDLGRVPFDKQVEARFELANTGGEAVRLVDRPLVKTLEGC